MLDNDSHYDYGLVSGPIPDRVTSPHRRSPMNEFFSPVLQRAQLSTHSAGHSNALVENPFDEVEATEAD
jgi:hypothetical protein